MNAELKPITTRALVRPSYCHPELLGVDRGAWVLVNLPALEDRYRACGPDDEFNEDEFRRFTWVQYDLECDNGDELKREWATLPRERRRD